MRTRKAWSTTTPLIYLPIGLTLTILKIPPPILTSFWPPKTLEREILTRPHKVLKVVTTTTTTTTLKEPVTPVIMLGGSMVPPIMPMTKLFQYLHTETHQESRVDPVTFQVFCFWNGQRLTEKNSEHWKGGHVIITPPKAKGWRAPKWWALERGWFRLWKWPFCIYSSNRGLWGANQVSSPNRGKVDLQLVSNWVMFPYRSDVPQEWYWLI